MMWLKVLYSFFLEIIEKKLGRGWFETRPAREILT